MKKFFALTLIALTFASLGTEKAFSADYPSKYDLRTLGYVPAVMDQGTDQTCWTFAAMSAITSSYLKSAKEYNHGNFLGNDSDLSKLHLAWFSFKNPEKKKSFAFTKYGEVVEPADYEVLNHAGNPQMALAFLSRHDGPVKESELPYNGGYPAAGKGPRDYKRALRVRGANYLESFSTTQDVILTQEDMIKDFLMSMGAVDIGVYWDKYYVSSNNAYYNPSTRNGGHAVTIVGWDDNYSRENFSPAKPSKNGAWLVQNSWGTSWGEQGYFWMSYDQAIRYAMSFYTEEFNPGIREYEHDDLGFTHEVLLSEEESPDVSVAVANIFKVKGDHETLREIGYYSTGSTFAGLLAVIDMGTENSIESFNKARKGDESQITVDIILGFANKGYNVHTLNKPVPLVKDHYIGIMVSLVSLSALFGGGSSVDIEGFKPTIAAEVNVPGTRTANAEINANETYFSNENGNWYDAKDYTFNVGSETVTGFNACIKGFSYIPDVRRADDWSIISKDNKAQLSIPIYRETAPSKISVKGEGLSNVVYKIEPDIAVSSSADGENGKFYILKVISDFTSNDVAITSLIIDGEEMMTGNMRDPKANFLTEYSTSYVDISKAGVTLKNMTSSSGTIDDTKDYTPSDESQSTETQEQEEEEDDSNTSKTHSGGGGCTSVEGIGALVALMMLLVPTSKTKFMK